MRRMPGGCAGAAAAACANSTSCWRATWRATGRRPRRRSVQHSGLCSSGRTRKSMRSCWAGCNLKEGLWRVSWSAYGGPLEFPVGPSRALGAWIALGHLLATGGVLGAGLHPATLIPVLVSFALALRTALHPLGPGVRAIAWCPARGWERILVSSNREQMELRASSVVTTGAMFLHWDACGQAWRVLLPRDAMCSVDWRRMSVIVGLYDGRDRMPAAAGFATPAGRTSGTAPGLSEWRMDSPGFRGACPDGHEKQRPVAGREGPAR